MSIINKRENDFISGVFNYCDRWCERCRFAMQCRLYADLAGERGYIRKTESMEELLQDLSAAFSRTLAMIRKWSAEAGVDPDALAAGSEAARNDIDHLRAKIKSHPLGRITSDYIRKVDEWFEKSRASIENRLSRLQQDLELGISPDESLDTAYMIRDAVEIIQNYKYSIHVKTCRALHGLFEKEDCYGDGPHQTDYNGSAKVALAMIASSADSFRTIKSILPASSKEVEPILLALKKTAGLFKAVFPNARRFVRPGFDTHP